MHRGRYSGQLRPGLRRTGRSRGFGLKGGHLGLELADYNKRGTAYFKMVDGKVQYDVQDQLKAQGFMRGSATGSDAAKAQ